MPVLEFVAKSLIMLAFCVAGHALISKMDMQDPFNRILATTPFIIVGSIPYYKSTPKQPSVDKL